MSFLPFPLFPTASELAQTPEQNVSPDHSKCPEKMAKTPQNSSKSCDGLGMKLSEWGLSFSLHGGVDAWIPAFLMLKYSS